MIHNSYCRFSVQYIRDASWILNRTRKIGSLEEYIQEVQCVWSTTLKLVRSMSYNWLPIARTDRTITQHSLRNARYIEDLLSSCTEYIYTRLKCSVPTCGDTRRAILFISIQCKEPDFEQTTRADGRDRNRITVQDDETWWLSFA